MAKNSSRAFSANERVSHSIYGLGTINEINELHTTIDFDQNGRRKFVTSIVQLEPTDVPAPAPTGGRARSKTREGKAKKS